MSGKEKKTSDYTSTARGARRTKMLDGLGLKELRVVGHPDDADVIKEYAQNRYKARGITYEPNKKQSKK